MIVKEITSKKYDAACDCPITSAINVIGGKWKPVIIWILMPGSKRFGEIHKTIPGMALKVLSRHLKELEADGVVTRKAYAEVPPRVEYTLTPKGRALNGIMDLLVDWSREYVMEAV